MAILRVYYQSTQKLNRSGEANVAESATFIATSFISFTIMATLKKLDWKTIIHKLVTQKNKIQAHDQPERLKDVRFITPLSLPNQE